MNRETAGGARVWRVAARRLFEPIDPASIAVFRIAFGALMAWEVWRYFSHDWIRRYYITPGFHFTYYGFEWVSPWRGDGMYVHFAALGLLAVCVAVGFMSRVAAALFFVLFTYVFLLEQARYLNHFYLISLLSLLLAIVPAHAIWSLDARRRPGLPTVPAWSLWLLRFQVAMPYVYGGIAKLNHDWLRGEPLRAWMAHRTDLPVIGRWLTQEWAVMLFAWGGLLLDLCIVPLLLWRKTRLVGLALAVVFHTLNAQVFAIGVFPPLMLAATLLFFPPDWPRRLPGSRTAAPAPAAPRMATVTGRQRAVVALLAVYAAVQLLVPLRHWLYPGNVAWTEEGHTFSWRMKLRDKDTDATFVAVDAESGRTWVVDARDYLSRWQYEEMASRPDMILQFAHYLGRTLSAREGRRIGVRVLAEASLNGRPRQPLIDPTVDLTTTPRTLAPSAWIVPLDELRPR